MVARNFIHPTKWLFWNLYDIEIDHTKSGSLKNETENNYYKVIIKCDRSLLQSVGQKRNFLPQRLKIY